MNVTDLKIYTIGHGDRGIGEFRDILAAVAISVLVDVRYSPDSAGHPEYSQDNLRESLEGVGITCHWAGRHPGKIRKTSAHSKHTALEADSMRVFADHMGSAEFHKA